MRMKLKSHCTTEPTARRLLPALRWISQKQPVCQYSGFEWPSVSGHVFIGCSLFSNTFIFPCYFNFQSLSSFFLPKFKRRAWSVKNWKGFVFNIFTAAVVISGLTGIWMFLITYSDSTCGLGWMFQYWLFCILFKLMLTLCLSAFKTRACNSQSLLEDMVRYYC